MTDEDVALETYGNLYKKMATASNEIPIGIYRTEKRDQLNKDRLVSGSFAASCLRKLIFLSTQKLTNNIQRLLEIKMARLKIHANVHDNLKNQMNSLSYVLINPLFDFKLQAGDIVYLLKPGKPN